MDVNRWKANTKRYKSFTKPCKCLAKGIIFFTKLLNVKNIRQIPGPKGN